MSTTTTRTTRTRRWRRWVVGAVIAAVVVVVGGPFVYFHFIQADPPPKPSAATITVPTTVAGTTRASLAGTWTVDHDSFVGYRVTETVFGQSGTAVGRTKQVTGSMTVVGTKLTSAAFTADMTSVASDESQRDGQFQNRIMDTADFPTATFTLTSPVELGPAPPDGTAKTYTATGKLQLHGTTNTVTLRLEAKRVGNVIVVTAEQPITFSDYKIDNPSGGPASVGNSGTLEIALQFAPKT